MTEYIERDEAIRKALDACIKVVGHGITQFDAVDIVEIMESIPTADVKEVQHGYWEEWWDDNYLSYCHKCSECGSYPLTKEETTHDEVLSNFCPNCGAKMDGKE